MKAQTLGLTIAAGVTGAYLLAVGFVVAWQIADLPPEPRPFVQAPRNEIVFNDIAQDMPIDPMPVQPERFIAVEQLPAVRGVTVAAKDMTVSEPHARGNLALFLIHGPDTINDAPILTLQEGLEQNLVTVRDTGVHIRIDNRSNSPLFIQSGDIVKGGNQDRVLPYDMLVGARTTGTPVAALCVEQNRSTPRGNEMSASFQTSTEQLPTRSLKLAAVRGTQAQTDVWNNVKNLQSNLARNTGGSVESKVSQSSLQLSLEHQRVQGAVQDYFTPLAPILEGKDDVIGFAVVVNGKVQSADVYGSAALFQKLWPKLLRASAVEALSQRQPNASFEAPTITAVQTFLADAEQGQAARMPTTGRGVTIRLESGPTLLFDTCDTGQQNVVLHRSYLAK